MGAWATDVISFVPGLLNINNPGLGTVGTIGTSVALGPADTNGGDVKSFGDGGSMVIEFVDAIHNGLGDDFAVFENGFLAGGFCFCELAFVEVSTDGVIFVEFESETLNSSSVGGFTTLDSSDYRNFAGKHPQGGAFPLFWGTGFDLEELALHPLVLSGAVYLGDIRFVRLTDVIGDGSTLDSFGNPVFDPYPTAFGTGGFDLNAVGVINVPEPDFGLLSRLGVLWLLFCQRFRRGNLRAAGCIVY